MLNNVSNISALNANNSQLNALLNDPQTKIIHVHQNYYFSGQPVDAFAPQFGGYALQPAQVQAQQQLPAFGYAMIPQGGVLGGSQGSPFSLSGYPQPQPLFLDQSAAAGWGGGNAFGGSPLSGGLLGGGMFGASPAVGNPYAGLGGGSLYNGIYGSSNSITLLLGALISNLQNIIASLNQLFSLTPPATDTGSPAPNPPSTIAVGEPDPNQTSTDKPALPDEPVVGPPLTAEPPVAVGLPVGYEKVKILGSAGLFGDPQFGLFSTDLGPFPEQLKSFDSGIKNGEIVTLIDDADNSGLNVAVKGIQVDPLNEASTGVGEVSIKSGSDVILFKNNGDLVINEVVQGNLNDNGLLAPITLANGAVIASSQEIDGAGGIKAERFSFINGEYKITAALRHPHVDSIAFFDMNFEELVKDAADNASGYATPIPGLTKKFGIVDLLRIEPDDQL